MPFRSSGPHRDRDRHAPAGRAVLLAVLVLAPPAAASEPTFDDPYAYCAAVGTIDAPDSRYTGPKMPEFLAEALRDKFAAPRDASLEAFVNNSFWRCMDGKVYACNVGANIPCQEKADASRAPSQGMVDYCENNRDTDHIPAFVTGRATIYLWSCRDGKAVVAEELTKADARGFLANSWYELSPP